ncbi:MAG: aminotransferase class I/II-fold pyridoxal phosphate-dependent enzyme [Erysipelotrichaceae bacterium]|nr:aminotransferase class I/II-fold pyridoxal phosphate-dependent enzyme [Erysipelotrichaceae bacterium]
MQLPDFKTEQWMNDYEKQAVHNLTDTTVQAASFQELLALEPQAFSNLILDYGDIPGSQALRQEILSLYENRDSRTLSIANGCLEANFAVMETLLKPGDRIITPVPGYQQFLDVPKALGCEADTVRLSTDDWKLDLDGLEQAVREETKMIILNNPSNPTGALLSRQELLQIADIARRHDLWVLCDEAFLLPDADHPSFSDLYEKGISTSSLSKTLGLAGIRLGWIKGHPDVIAAIAVRNDYTMISAGPLRDTAAWIGLKHRKVFLDRAAAIMEQNRRDIENWLQTTRLFSVKLPAAGTTCFMKIHGEVDDVALCQDLLRDTGIFFVPGSCFDTPGYVRLGLGQKQNSLPEVLKALDSYVQNYLK